MLLFETISLAHVHPVDVHAPSSASVDISTLPATVSDASATHGAHSANSANAHSTSVAVKSHAASSIHINEAPSQFVFEAKSVRSAFPFIIT